MSYVGKCNKMALCAKYAYLDGEDAKGLYKELGYSYHRFFDVDGAQAHVVWNKDEFVLCFRGTEPTELSDVLADLNAWPDRAEVGGLVHNGFQNELEKLWPQLEKLIDRHTQAPIKFFITGHSLGGAMATIAASRCKDSVTALFTYGSPRVGNRTFIDNFKNVKHYRHVNNNDIVTGVPFWLMGYRHHSEARYINFYGNIRKVTPWQRFKDKWRGRWAALKKGMPFDGAVDHGMDYYCEYTERAERAPK